MNVKLLIEQHLEFLSLKGGCTGSSESIRVKMPHYWKSHFTAQLFYASVMGFYKLGLFIFKLARFQLVSHADNLCKQFGPRSGRIQCQARSGSELLDTLMVFRKVFFSKTVDFEKNQQPTK